MEREHFAAPPVVLEYTSRNYWAVPKSMIPSEVWIGAALAINVGLLALALALAARM